MKAKAVNDAAAYIRSLAQLRGRNADFAERAVREASSLSAEEALEAGVIDVIADGRSRSAREDRRPRGAIVDAKAAAADSAGARDRVARARLAHQAARPCCRTRRVALMLLMIGIYGLFVEFTHPGFGVPGVVGAIALLLALLRVPAAAGELGGARRCCCSASR